MVEWEKILPGGVHPEALIKSLNCKGTWNREETAILRLKKGVCQPSAQVQGEEIKNLKKRRGKS